MLVASLPIFFLSGFSALVYQVIWKRMLVIFSGTDVQATTIVVAAFMAGLGCGSLVGGRIADRVSRHTGLALFGIAEVCVAAIGWQSQWVLYDLLYVRWGHLAADRTVMASMLFGTLFWPTFLMGLSLPLLSCALTTDTSSAPRTIGWLFTVNTLGASIGALCTLWWLLPGGGLEAGLHVASVVNVVCAIAAIPVATMMRRREAREGLNDSSVAPAPSGLGFEVWCALYALSGFVALSFEIVWFRLLGVMLKSTAYTFGTLLAQYLFWLAAGAALGGLVVKRARRPGLWFLVLYAAAGAYSGISIAAIVGYLNTWPPLSQPYSYLGGYDPLNIVAAPPLSFWGLYVALPAAVVGPPTLLMGMGFPFLQRAVHTDLATLGRKVGTLLFANILASTLGTIATGWLLLGWLGTAGTSRLLVALTGIFGLTGAWKSRRTTAQRTARLVAVLLALGIIIYSMPSARVLWARVHGTPRDHIQVAEDETGVSALRAEG